MEAQNLQQILNQQFQQAKRISAGEAGNPDKQAEFSKALLTQFIEKANEIMHRNTPSKMFIVDSTNIEIISKLCLYFAGVETEELPLTKGILLSGEVGVGKSLMFKAFSEALKNYGKSFRIVSCQDVVFGYENTGELDLYMGNEKGYSGKPAKFCFDEIGRETIPAMHFGNKRNVMQHILAYRYNYWQSHGLITHGTTNASPQEIISVYGEHIADRIKEMFNYLVIKGESKR